MLTAPLRGRTASSSYARARPELSVIVATHNRARMLRDLLAALEAQEQRDPVEVVVVDDGSTDDTWAVLQHCCAEATLPVLALRVDSTGGPSVPRNTAAAHARGRLIASTDDDCLPEPRWTAAILAAAGGDDCVVRGPVRPVDDVHGPWDRTIDVAGPTPWFETCNLSMPTAAFIAAGGFPVLDLLPGHRGPRGFGEDVVLGQLLARSLPVRWAPGAVVRHRWLPGRYRDHLAGQWRVVGFPPLMRAIPHRDDVLWLHVFLSKRTASFDLAVSAVAVAVGRRQIWPVLGVLPWLAAAWPEARARARLRAPLRLLQIAVADAVTATALVAGSVYAKRPVL